MSLEMLEAESIHIIREVAAEFERPALLFSGGKDSIVMLRLAEKAFRPAPMPFALVHVDTGHNFPEVLDYRDKRVAELGVRLIVASVQDSIDAGRVIEQTGPRASRNRLQTTTLLDVIAEHRFDVAFGGARRDEEKARAKERIFSFRDEFGQWDPRNQRPGAVEPVTTADIRPGEHIRVFPLSNWTELDVWRYIARESSTCRRSISRTGARCSSATACCWPTTRTNHRDRGRVVSEATVRYRTVGDMTCTGAVLSGARTTVDEIIQEVAATRITERGATRADDRTSEAAMEDRKREGYF